MKILLGSEHSSERLRLTLPIIVCESQIIFALLFLDMMRTLSLRETNDTLSCRKTFVFLYKNVNRPLNVRQTSRGINQVEDSRQGKMEFFVPGICIHIRFLPPRIHIPLESCFLNILTEKIRKCLLEYLLRVQK